MQRGLNVLPRNMQQLKNYRRSGKKKDTNVLYSVMLQCKVCKGKEDAFVRDVKAAPEPQLRGIKAWVCMEKLKVIYLLKNCIKKFHISYVTLIYGHL